MYKTKIRRRKKYYASQLGRFIRKTKTIFYQAKNLNFAFFKMNVHFIYRYIIINMYICSGTGAHKPIYICVSVCLCGGARAQKARADHRTSNVAAAAAAVAAEPISCEWVCVCLCIFTAYLPFHSLWLRSLYVWMGASAPPHKLGMCECVLMFWVCFCGSEDHVFDIHISGRSFAVRFDVVAVLMLCFWFRCCCGCFCKWICVCALFSTFSRSAHLCIHLHFISYILILYTHSLARSHTTANSCGHTFSVFISFCSAYVCMNMSVHTFLFYSHSFHSRMCICCGKHTTIIDQSGCRYLDSILQLDRLKPEKKCLLCVLLSPLRSNNNQQSNVNWLNRSILRLAISTL